MFCDLSRGHPSTSLPEAGAEGQICGEHSYSPQYYGPGRMDSSALLLSVPLSEQYLLPTPFSCIHFTLPIIRLDLHLSSYSSFPAPFQVPLPVTSFPRTPATLLWLCNALLGESPSPHPPPGLPLLHPAVPPTCCRVGDQGQDQQEGPTCCHPFYVCPNPQLLTAPQL